jgi:ParB-like chromosome segregation protein Spo0J
MTDAITKAKGWREPLKIRTLGGDAEYLKGPRDRAIDPTILRIADITIGERHRKDVGDLQPLADSIRELGLLQVIGVTTDCRLIFGERRLLACRDILGWIEIPARVIEIDDIAVGEHDENELRKDFTPSERVAILATIERNKHGGDRKSDQEQNIAVDANTAAKLAGFGNKETARQARLVVDQGVEELVIAMDRGEISVAAAAVIAKEPPAEQKRIVRLPPAERHEAVQQARAKRAITLSPSIVDAAPLKVDLSVTRPDPKVAPPNMPNRVWALMEGLQELTTDQRRSFWNLCAQRWPEPMRAALVREQKADGMPSGDEGKDVATYDWLRGR